MRAARMIGGDFYDAYQINDHQFGFVVADVSGKGVPAALFMILVKTILEEQAMNHASPAACIQRLNSQLIINNPLSLFVTLIYGVLDTNTGILTFCNAGHSMPYVIRNNQKIETITNKSNPLVGLLDHPQYTNISIQLERNDRVLLITDGVTECFNRESVPYGELRLLNLLHKSHHLHQIEDLVNSLIDDLDHFSNGTPASDDITALVLRYTNPSEVVYSSVNNPGNLRELTI
jgi:sigma-B regulation protein RsbU (phosphoserine phosphatase)